MRGSWGPLGAPLLLLLLLWGTAAGFRYSRNVDCVFNSSADVKFIDSYFYNKLEFLRFDSAVGWYVGFTAFGVNQAHIWNQNQTQLDHERRQKDLYCVNNTQLWFEHILSKSVEPYAVLHTAPSADHQRVLLCSVYSFYPKEITVTWTNHSQPLRGAVVTSTGSMPDSDWYYQIHSHLEYTPRYYTHLQYSPRYYTHLQYSPRYYTHLQYSPDTTRTGPGLKQV